MDEGKVNDARNIYLPQCILSTSCAQVIYTLSLFGTMAQIIVDPFVITIAVVLVICIAYASSAYSALCSLEREREARKERLLEALW